MIKLRPKRFSRSSSKLGGGGGSGGAANATATGEIKWELRPGGMLVQKRECKDTSGEGVIRIRVSAVSQWHDISIQATSTFGK
ncbi:BAG family molecular chaperone regulator 2 [Sesamum angolense]|uniref:BAG family molecular chaperone regulator 2 n=1 Tax=Sesamum angolense TaxID=2727404 RepID=A0AAE2BPF9_9LAMI|nr:BAG family molecular chaperone regulator 2 [Sesamum angolense]